MTTAGGQACVSSDDCEELSRAALSWCTPFRLETACLVKNVRSGSEGADGVSVPLLCVSCGVVADLRLST